MFTVSQIRVGSKVNILSSNEFVHEVTAIYSDMSKVKTGMAPFPGFTATCNRDPDGVYCGWIEENGPHYMSEVKKIASY